MSPEQTLGEPVDYRSDIYSLGATMFEIIMGHPPFTSGDIGYQHVHTPPPNPTNIDPSIPEALSHAILTCMEKDPSRRYQSTKELFSDLKKLG
jgi:serine/threonine-protein kinase